MNITCKAVQPPVQPPTTGPIIGQWQSVDEPPHEPCIPEKDKPPVQPSGQTPVQPPVEVIKQINFGEPDLVNYVWLLGGEGVASGKRGPRVAQLKLYLEKNFLKKLLEDKTLTKENFEKQILSVPIKLSITNILGIGTPEEPADFIEKIAGKANGPAKKSQLMQGFVENADKFVKQGVFTNQEKATLVSMLDKNLQPEYPSGSIIEIVTGPCPPFVVSKLPGKPEIKATFSDTEGVVIKKFYSLVITLKDTSSKGLRDPQGRVESTADRLYRKFYGK